MQIIEPNQEQLNNFVIAQSGSFQQSWQWGELQERMQRPVKRFLVMDGEKPLLAASFVRHDLPLGKFYWLCPRGPVIHDFVILNEVKNLRLREILQSLPLLQNDKPVFIRIEPELPTTDNLQLTTYGFLKAPKDHNPRATILLDLTKSREELLAGMHPKTRYNLRLAMKKEVQITSSPFPLPLSRRRGGGGEGGIAESKVREFLDLLQQTAKRDRFHLHPKSYYQELLKLPEISLFLAYFSEKLVAGAIVSFFAGRATYLHGASDYDSRQLMAPYLLHWEIMRSAAAAGMKTYDFGGVAPRDETRHPLANLNRFKSGFGGKYVEYVGSYDYVLDKFWYGVYKFGRRIL